MNPKTIFWTARYYGCLVNSIVNSLWLAIIANRWPAVIFPFEQLVIYFMPMQNLLSGHSLNLFVA